jgi:hypothetical protein
MGVRRINMTTVPFNYHWPRASAVTVVRDLGEVLLKDEVADAAVARGYGVEMAPPAKEGTPTKRIRPPKVKKATPAPKTATPESNGAAADPGQPAGVDRADLAHHDRADSGDAVAPAVER